MRHAQTNLLTVVGVGILLAGCATTPKRDESAKTGGAPEKASGAAPATAAGPGLCAPIATAVPTGITGGPDPVLYLQVEGGIEAVDLKTGATLWRSTNAASAVAVGEKYVAGTLPSSASSNALTLQLLDRRTGALVSVGPDLTLGEQVVAGTAHVRGAFCSESEVELLWSGAGGSGRAKAELLQRRVTSGPTFGGAPLGGVIEATVSELSLTLMDGSLRAYDAQGALRWERPLHRQSAALAP